MQRLNVQADIRSRIASKTGVDVRTSVPKDRPAELVVVRREGGGMRDALVDQPGIGVDVWALSEARACEIMSEVSDAVMSLGFADGYAEVTEEVMRSDYDVLKRTPHWYASYSLKTYKPVR